MEPKHPPYPHEERYRPFCVDPTVGLYVVFDSINKVSVSDQIKRRLAVEKADELNKAEKAKKK